MPLRIPAKGSAYPEEVGDGGLACVKFTAEWCGPCHKIQPLFEALARARPDIACYTVQVDDDSEVLNQRLSVEAVPRFLFLRDGAEETWVDGADEASLTKSFRTIPPVQEDERRGRDDARFLF